jgi:hypothetical protein
VIFGFTVTDNLADRAGELRQVPINVTRRDRGAGRGGYPVVPIFDLNTPSLPA